MAYTIKIVREDNSIKLESMGGLYVRAYWQIYDASDEIEKIKAKEGKK